MDGIAASAAESGELFAGKSMLPAVEGFKPDDAGILDSESWIECMLAQPGDIGAQILKMLPIHEYIEALWIYAIEARWTPVLSLQPALVFHHVATFCQLARFAVEVLSFNGVPINIERACALARARMILDAHIDPRCDSEEQVSESLGLEDIAPLAEIAPQSVRNALNAEGKSRLVSRRHRGTIVIDSQNAQRWLSGRKRYVPTDFSQLDRYMTMAKGSAS